MKNSKVKTVTCDYCGKNAQLVTGADIYPHREDLRSKNFWRCFPCLAYVGCHEAGNGYGNGTRPLGRLANATLRKAKQAAHAAIDPHWREGRFKRMEVYSKLAKLMKLKSGEAHIGEFDEALCATVVLLGKNSALWKR